MSNLGGNVAQYPVVPLEIQKTCTIILIAPSNPTGHPHPAPNTLSGTAGQQALTHQ